MAPRFFAPPAWVNAERARVEGEAAHRIARVLRLRPGDMVELCDGSGQVFQVQLNEISPQGAWGRVQAVKSPSVEPGVYLTLYQAIIREKRMAWLLEKATEVGISRIVPLTTERTVRAKEGRVDASRLRRWERIVREAAEQSRRTRLPEVAEAMTFDQVCQEIRGIALICCTQASTRPLQQALLELWEDGSENVELLIGPEGGWSPSEVEQAIAAGMYPVSLGRRILRSETAGVVASALALATLEENR